MKTQFYYREIKLIYFVDGIATKWLLNNTTLTQAVALLNKSYPQGFRVVNIVFKKSIKTKK